MALYIAVHTLKKCRGGNNPIHSYFLFERRRKWKKQDVNS